MAKYALYQVKSRDCGHVYTMWYRVLCGVAAPCEFWSNDRWVMTNKSITKKLRGFMAQGATVKLIGIGVST